VGESEHKGRDPLAQQEDSEPSAIDEAREFLIGELAGGAVASKQLFASARELGIAEKTLRRAAKRAGVEHRKAAFAGGWEWVLPLSGEDGQGVWPPSSNGTVGHLREDGSTMPVASHFEGVANAEDAQLTELATFAVCPVCESSDVGPTSGTCRACGTRVHPAATPAVSG
jgi:hypothetical protein